MKVISPPEPNVTTSNYQRCYSINQQLFCNGRPIERSFKIRYQHRRETYHLVIYATQLREICLDTQMSLAHCLEFHTRYVSSYEVLQHFPTWPPFCKHHVKGHRNGPVLETQACTHSLSPPGLDTNTGTQPIPLLYLPSSFPEFDTITMSLFSNDKLEFIVSVSAPVLQQSIYFLSQTSTWHT